MFLFTTGASKRALTAFFQTWGHLWVHSPPLHPPPPLVHQCISYKYLYIAHHITFRLHVFVFLTLLRGAMVVGGVATRDGCLRTHLNQQNQIFLTGYRDVFQPCLCQQETVFFLLKQTVICS